MNDQNTAMQISRAKPEAYQEIRLFYHSLIDAMQGAKYHPEWKKDVYPAPEDLQSAIVTGTLYVGRIDGQIAAAMVVNQKCNNEYENAPWTAELEQTDFMVIHMLGVHPEFSGKGYAKSMVRYAIHIARQARMKAVRLDVLEGNLPAERLYSGLGFSYVETVSMFYEDTGWKNFKLCEYSL